MSTIGSDEVIADLRTHQPSFASVLDALDMSSSRDVLKLADHIESLYQRAGDQEIPRVRALLDRIVTKQGGSHRELFDVQRLFLALERELSLTRSAQERSLFPYVRFLASGTPDPRQLDMRTNCRLTTVRNSEVIARDLLAGLREVTDNWTAPAGVGPCYRELCDALQQLDHNFSNRVSQKTNKLLPLASALQRQLASSR